MPNELKFDERSCNREKDQAPIAIANNAMDQVAILYEGVLIFCVWESSLIKIEPSEMTKIKHPRLASTSRAPKNRTRLPSRRSTKMQQIATDPIATSAASSHGRRARTNRIRQILRANRNQLPNKAINKSSVVELSVKAN